VRTLSAQEAQVAKAAGYAARLRVRVADGGGTLRDLTALDLAGGRDFTRSIRVERHVDQDFAVATFTVRRQLDRWNISPLVTTSKLNIISNSYSPLLARGRLCVVESYLLPSEMAPSSGDWREVFRGTVGTVDEAQDTIDIQALDQWHTLADAPHFLEVERPYGSGGGVAVQTVMQQLINDSYGQPFTASGAYANRDRVHPTTANGFWYQSESTASAGAEPSWPTTVGNTVVSGSVTFRCMGTIPQLYTPSSPSWNIAPAYQQKRMSCWQAIRALVNQFGWQLLDKYDSGTSSWRLTLIQPDRTKNTPDFTWYPDTTDAAGAAVPSILALSSWRTGVEDVRNVIELTFSNRSVLDTAGKPTRQKVSSRDATSIDANGWRWISISEQAASQISSTTEAQRMTDALRDDMKDPLATHEVVCPLFWPAELGDLYRFKANGYSYTSDQDLAVAGIQHEQGESGAATTRLTCRGKPSAGFERWRALGYDVSALRPATFNGPDQVTGVTIAQVQGGLAVTWAKATAGAEVKEYELHISTSNGFTPGSSTLKAVTDATSKTIPDLVPGTTYYAVIVPRGLLGERGTASAQASTTAGYTKPRDMQPRVSFETTPPNHDFEANNGSGPPDRWTDPDAKWGVRFFLESSVVQSGGKSIKVAGTTSGEYWLFSDYFPINAGAKYYSSVWYRNNSPTTLDFASAEIYFYDGALSGVGSRDLVNTYYIGGVFDDVWQEGTNTFTPVAGALYARAAIHHRAGAGSYTTYYDNIKVEEIPISPWTALSFGTSWTNWTDANYHNPEFTKDSTTGRIQLRGLAKNTNAANLTIGTLPVGHRPLKRLIFVIDANDAPFYVEVQAGGAIVCRSTPVLNQWHSLANISFIAEQ
jgi:hypothetical protein